MKVFVTGVCGQLGHDLTETLKARGHHVIGSDISPAPAGEFCVASYIRADITDAAEIGKVISDLQPDAIIHCAAWTSVDAAEEKENRAIVFRVNGDGTRNIAAAARDVGAKMVYISTDYVFDGQGQQPWEADCKTFAPLNVYGNSKLRGERSVSELLEKYFIVRTAWLFGINGGNFINTMLRVGKDRSAVTVVDDQIGTPTYTEDLSRLLADMIETDRYGFYHATNSEETPGAYISWADLAEEIYRIAGYNTRVQRVTTAEYGLNKAVRPFNSRLDKSKLQINGFRPLPGWKDAVKRYIIKSREEAT